MIAVIRRSCATFSPRLFFFLSVLALCWPSSSSGQLEVFFKDYNWNTSQEEFEKTWKDKGFEWTSNLKNTARHPGVVNRFDPKSKKFVRESLKIGKVEVGETLVQFGDEGIKLVEISAYNRGDDETIVDERKFFEKTEQFKKMITAQSDARPEEAGRDFSSASRLNRTVWKNHEKGTQYLLEWSTTKDSGRFQAEFLHVKLGPIPTGLANLANTHYKRPTVTRLEMQGRVKRNDKGDVFIDSVPMVDQGAKGYCAVAASSRVMLYYGIDASQHEIAQLAATDERGTNRDDMIATLKKASSKFGLKFNKIEDVDDREMNRLIKSYNRQAKRDGRKETPDPDKFYFNPWEHFDIDTLRSVRQSGSGYSDFQNKVRSYIDQGVPLIWSLMLGLYPEEGKENPQGGGGHMRLIIGYNSKTDEILFSDSWGAGHELKRMKMADAYACTTSVTALHSSR